MPRMPVERTDPRQRVANQGYHVSFGGYSLENGPSGQEELLPLAFSGYAYFEFDIGTRSLTVQGDIPGYCWIDQVLQVQTTVAAGDLTVDLPAYNGMGAHTLVNAQTLAGAGPITTVATYDVSKAGPRPIRASITAGAAGTKMILAVRLNPFITGWK